MSVTPGKLSGSTDGKPIKITSTTSGAADTLHTGVAGTSSIDYVWLDVTNNSAAAVDLYIGWGGVTVDETLGPISIAADAGPVRVAERCPIQNGQVVKAWAGSPNTLLITGGSHRYTP